MKEIMKKIEKLFLCSCLLLLITGCMKYDVTMDVKKDKSMNLSIIYALAVDNGTEYKDYFQQQTKDIKELKEKGFKVEEYKSNGYVGYRLTSKIKNIDNYSSKKDVEMDISSFMQGNLGNKFFKVKKGLFVNVYTAKIPVENVRDSFTSMTSMTNSNSETNIDTTEDDFGLTDDATVISSDTTNDSYDNFDSALQNLNFDTKDMKLNYTINLPYKAISNNAPKTYNDSKTLTWDMFDSNLNNIEYQFFIFNIKTIAIGIGSIVLIGVCIFLCLKFKKK